MQPGQRYGYRVHGPYDPEKGLRCNPNKLLLDPYAKATVGDIDWDQSLFGYDFGDADSRNDDDSAAAHDARRRDQPVLRLGGRPPARHPLQRVAHLRGARQGAHPAAPRRPGGACAARTPASRTPRSPSHLTRLGVTAIELMPVHQFVQDSTLLDKGLRNYWGYNTLGFFAPHADYAVRPRQLGQQVQEFKAMVKAMHAAGIEVILDVVYNHTAEGNHLGPTLSFKGIDNPAYYRRRRGRPRYYMDYTGTGNSLNVRHPHSLQLIMDSLRYWVTEMHVDGFRFDLASALAREFYDVDRLPTFFELVQQDPVVSQVKLIAEPWDVGPGGYQVGNFPPQWTEWNGKYRDTVRDFWRGEPSLGEFASRLAGSSDLYEHSGRRPFASINFVTAHDGFTLRDLVSYNEKHNEANGEDNNDGESHNRSWNHGVEGPTDDPEVLALRARAQRNFLATLLLSQGVPMLLHGDELGRTQDGNNNTYAQDSEISWMHWDQVDEPLVEFTAAVARLRARRTRRSAASGSSPARPSAPATASGSTTSSGCTSTAGRWRTATGRPTAPGDRDVPQRPRHRRPRRRGNQIARRPLPALLQRRRPTTSADAAAGGVRRGVGRRHRHRGGRRVEDDPRAAGRRSTLAGRSVLVLREHPEPEAEPDHSVAAALGGAGRAGLRAARPRQAVTPRKRRRDAHPGQHLPAADHRRASTCSRRPGGCAYLHDLGVDWVYLSPLLAAEPGSDHGYDVVDHDRDRPVARAAPRAWRRCRPRRAGSAWACSSTSCPTTSASPPRARTRGGGTCSRTAGSRAYAAAFDVDWDAGGGRVRIPVVGDDDLAAGRPDREPAGRSAASCATTTTASRSLPAPARRRRRRRRGARPAALRAGQLAARPTPSSTTGASSRSTRWPAIRVEDPEGLRRLARARSGAGSTRGSSTGCGSTTPTACATPAATSTTWPTLTGGAYVLVEKILEPGEELPPSWATAGTTGYDALALVDRVLTDPAGQEPLDALETRLRGGPVDWHELVHDTKRAVADGILRLRGPPDRPRAAREPAADRRPVARAARATRSPSCWPASRSTAPTCPRAASTSTQAFAAAREPPARPRRRRSTSLAPVLADPARRAGAALPADQRHGDGQGRRGLRVLPLRRG